MNSRYPFAAFPNGWFSVSAGADLAPGDVRAVTYLGRDLVLFRGEDRSARVFDAHCPHLGAHLGVGGRVCGDGIACPFPGWRFDGDGQLIEVPGLDRTPKATVQAWRVCERNRRIFVWHHAGGMAPTYEVIGYRPEEPSWTPWRCSTYRVRVHVQDLTENIIDRSHFSAVHDMAPPERSHFDVRFDGACMNEQFRQDVPIWENKIYRDRPMITKADGPLTQYRRWFRQFYSN